MQPFIAVRFIGTPNTSLETTVHRWVARFEVMSFEVHRTVASVDTRGRRTGVRLWLTLTDGRSASVTSSHADPYVAISDAFRAARRDLLAPADRNAPLPAYAVA